MGYKTPILLSMTLVLTELVAAMAGGLARAQSAAPPAVKAPTIAPTTRIRLPGADFSVRITAVRYVRLELLRNLDDPASREIGRHHVRVFWELPEASCLGRQPDAKFSYTGELTLPDGTRRSGRGDLDASAECSGVSCASEVVFGGAPGDPRPRAFRIDIRGTVAVRALGGGSRREPPAPPPSRAGEITIPPGAVATNFPLEITDLRYVSGQPGGPELRVFWKAPSARCYGKVIVYDVELRATITSGAGQASRDARATRKVDLAEHCSPTACVSAVKLAAPSGITPRVLEATLSAIATTTATGAGTLQGAF
jgi:hypothetical protein